MVGGSGDIGLYLGCTGDAPTIGRAWSDHPRQRKRHRLGMVWHLERTAGREVSAHWRDHGCGPILAEVLQDLCPRCGADWLDDSRACPACGFDPRDERAQAEGGTIPGIHLRPMGLVLLTLAMVVLVVVAFGVGWRLGSPSAVVRAPEPAVAPDTLDVVTVAQLGRVRFAERLGESLELEAYRTQFTAEDTIAWRAEFTRPPPANELTVIIAWQSIRERMQLSEATVTVRDAELAMIARDEVPLADLVPTAGLYSVTYFAGDTKLAEGVFELLPPDR